MLQNKRILITGGTGFIGSKVSKKLLDLGVPPENLLVTSSRTHDLKNKEVVLDIMQRRDIVIHLAAHSGAFDYYRDYPADVFYNNALMSMHLIDAAQKMKVKKFIQTSSVNEYPAAAKVPLREYDLWKGEVEDKHACYAYAKRFMLAQAKFYFKQHGFPYVHLILTNVYGPGMRLDIKMTGIAAIIQKIITAQQQGLKEIEFWGTGNATRDFVYIDDVVDAITLSASFPSNSVLNIASGEEIQIKEVVSQACELLGYTGKIVWNPDKPEGAKRSALDIGLAKSFGYRPQVMFSEGMRRTIEWFKNAQ